MKVVEIGEHAGNYESMVLQEGKKLNKFGKMFYLDERIYLVIRKPMTEYSAWTSAKDEVHLVFTMTTALKSELDAITMAASKQNPEFEFKKYTAGEKIYIKLRTDCAKIEVNGELQVSINVYGVFMQNATATAFLQMEIAEVQCKKISLLSKVDGAAVSINYSPWSDNDRF